jgi:acyl-CoA dehydrogenase
MDFELNEELKMIQSLARDFTEGQLKLLERDLLGRAADLSDARAYLPPEKEAELMKIAKEVGLWGAGIPEELGGAGLSTLGICLVEEELAKTIVPFNCGDVTPILFDGNKEQRQKFLQPALNNEKKPYLALLENDSTGIQNLSLKAVKENGRYLLNGSKIAFSRPSENYFGVVFGAGEKGLTCFLVDKDTVGFTVGGGIERTGWLAQMQEPLSLEFKECKVPEENILGEEGQAFQLGKKRLPQRRIVRGARAVGIAGRLLEEAGVRAEATQTFGQPISRRANIKAALADMAVNIHAARLIVYEAAAKADLGKDIEREAAMVKIVTANLRRSTADRVSHIFNGPRYSDGLSLERLCRHAQQADFYEAALAKQRAIIAGEVLKGIKY